MVKFKVGQKGRDPCQQAGPEGKEKPMQLGLPEAAFAQTPGMGPRSQSREDFPGLEGMGASCPMGQEERSFYMGTRCSVDQS